MLTSCIVKLESLDSVEISCENKFSDIEVLADTKQIVVFSAESYNRLDSIAGGVSITEEAIADGNIADGISIIEEAVAGGMSITEEAVAGGMSITV